MSSDLDDEQYTQNVKPFLLPPVRRWQDYDDYPLHNRDTGDEDDRSVPFERTDDTNDDVHIVHEHCGGYEKGFICCGCGQHKN